MRWLLIQALIWVGERFTRADTGHDAYDLNASILLERMGSYRGWLPTSHVLEAWETARREVSADDWFTYLR